MRYNINNLISAVADYSNMKDTKPSMKKQKISDAVIHRLPRYYRYLDDLYNKGVVRISSSLLGSKMERVKRIAWNELLFRAHEAGANGILAIRYDVYMLPKGLFGASVTGTAVAIEQLSQLNQALSQDLFGASVTSTAVKVKKA